jgi:hypothetical protein
MPESIRGYLGINGIGFTETQFRSHLRPNVSFKGGGTRGDKGVGATYLAYGFNFLQIGTKTSEFSYVGDIKGGREWVEDEKNIKPRPTVRPSTAIHSAFEGIDQGSTYCLKLTGDYIRPSNLTWSGAVACDQWETVLRIGLFLQDPRPSEVGCDAELHANLTLPRSEFAHKFCDGLGLYSPA